MPKITKTKAVEMIMNESKGRFITVEFTKKSGEKRIINCNVKKAPMTAAGYIRVNSIQDKGLRSVDPRTISAFKMNGTSYTVK
jgi:cytoplasmic iron level regulating protein YaaA (DUF328/UPF0246 family)